MVIKDHSPKIETDRTHKAENNAEFLFYRRPDAR
jgi:hypothetical protein